MMKGHLRKSLQVNNFYFGFSWGFYFSAGYFACQKKNKLFPLFLRKDRQCIALST